MAQDTIVGTDSVQDALKTKVNNDMTELFATKTEVENARDGSDTLLDQIDALQYSILSLTPSGGMCSAAPWSSRPAFGSINNGHLFIDTDTSNMYVADTTAERWIVRSGNRYAYASLPISGAIYTVLTGTTVYDTTNKEFMYYNGTAWEELDNLPDILLFGGI